MRGSFGHLFHRICTRIEASQKRNIKKRQRLVGVHRSLIVELHLQRIKELWNHRPLGVQLFRYKAVALYFVFEYIGRICSR